MLCPTLNNEIMNYLGGGSSDVSWTAGAGWSLGYGAGEGGMRRHPGTGTAITKNRALISDKAKKI